LGVEGEGGEVGCYGVCRGGKSVDESRRGGGWVRLWVEEEGKGWDEGGGEVEAKRTFRVELGVEVWVLGLEPVFALLCGAAEFTVLEYPVSFVWS
jgi:hypothetical protein